eukprot:TRINITY_DN8664_c0_g1_i1.p1 TRINITY_DN8664_c0_g1~~TRINITY_DN8664_c0_g1_i1.p1  ORF type:complete len:366 (+),score=98.04 TRINITY_DN8664_c0_g1_i1:50-1099(+)
MDAVLRGLVGLGLLYTVVQALRLARADSDLATRGARRLDYTGVVVWITGGSSGIGAELAKQVSARGGWVVISARTTPKLDAVKQACAHPERVLCTRLDLNDVESHGTAVGEVLREVEAASGRKGIDVLVNCGGRSERSLVEEHLDGVAVERTLFDVNFFGTVSLTKQVLKLCFLPGNVGKVVNVSSVGGKTAAPCSAAYSASKHALQGWSDSLRAELLDTGVTVCNICPGPIATPLGLSSVRADNTAAGSQAPADDTKGKMPVERCCMHIANVAHPRASVQESWISEHPVLLFLYIALYCPTLAKMLARTAYGKRIKAYKSQTGLYGGSSNSAASVLRSLFFGKRPKAD